MSNLAFNQALPSVMHIDLNSCFATIEQQANPLLRGHPIAVAAYDSPGGCILAPSIEAKRYGIKTGMRVKDARVLYPRLKVITPDSNKYRDVHKKLREVLKDYTYNFYPKSIDEFVLHFDGYPAFTRGLPAVANEIKKRIKNEVGDWLTVSVGIGTNRFMAKTGSGLHKPDGLDTIDNKNYENVFQNLELKDLNGINVRNEIRLNKVGIFTAQDFLRADYLKLKSAFRSILAYYWYLRLRGWEIDDIEFSRRSYGNSYAFPHSTGDKEELLPVLQKLTEKTGSRMRQAGFKAKGIHLSISYKDYHHWHHSHTLNRPIFDSRDIYKEAVFILKRCPHNDPVHVLAVSCFHLTKEPHVQLSLLEDVIQKQVLVSALDEINNRWGSFVVTPARMVLAGEAVKDRIAFGGVSEII